MGRIESGEKKDGNDKRTRRRMGRIEARGGEGWEGLKQEKRRKE